MANKKYSSYKRFILLSLLTFLMSICCSSSNVFAEVTEAAKLDESLKNADLEVLIQPLSLLQGDPVYDLITLESAYENLMNSTNFAVQSREEVHRIMDQPSFTQQVAESIIDTYQAKTTLHTVELHFVFEEEQLVLIQRDEHEQSQYKALEINPETLKSLQQEKNLTLKDLVSAIGPPSTTWYYVVQDETVYVWQSMIQSDLTAVVVTTDKEGNLKFTYLPK